MSNKEVYLHYYNILKKNFPEYTKLFSTNIFITILLSMLAIFFPYMLGKTINYIDKGEFNKLILICIALLVAKLTHHIFELLSRVVGSIENIKSENAIKRAFMKHIYNAEHESQAKTDVGTVMTEISRCSRSFSSINNIILLSVLPIIFQIFSVFFVVSSLVSTFFAIIFALGLIFLFYLAYWISEKNKKYYNEIYQVNNEINSFITNRLSILYESAINNARQDDYDKTKLMTESHQNSMISIMNKKIRLDALMFLSIWVFLALSVVYTIFFINVDSGTFVTTTTYVTQITMPFVAASQQISHIKGEFLSLQRGLKLFEMPLENKENKAIKESKIIYEFENLKYNNVFIEESKIFENELTIISGTSGSGKTTLLNILTGLNRSYSGNVYFCGEALRNLNSDNILSYVSVTSQEPIVIPGSLKDNLLWGNQNKDIKETKIIEVLSALSLGTFFEEHYESEVSLEQSINKRDRQLSGGEKKRLSIARAILKENKIGIFDEPTSGLDEQNAEKVIKAMRGYFPTLIIITHDTKIKKQSDKHIIL